VDLPDEDAFELDAEQLAAAVPRRGGRSARPFEPRPDTEWWQYTGIENRREELRQVAAEPETEPGLAAALLSYLDGKPDPVGAAVAFAAGDAIGIGLWGRTNYSQYDAWLGEHGPEFAAAAVMEYFTVATVHEVLRGVPVAYRHTGPVAIEYLPPDPDKAPWRDFGYELIRLRTHLAQMPEPAYRRIEAVLESQGRNPIQRSNRAFLCPERTDWVDEACAERPAWRFTDHRCDNRLIESVSSLDQLEKAGIAALSAQGAHPQLVCTLLEGVGLDCTPLLARAATLAGLFDPWRTSLHDTIAALPRDEAVRFFLERAVDASTWGRLQQVADRFPVRTLRSVAALAAEADTARSTRFIGLLRTRPLLTGAAYDVLEPADRDRIDALLAWRGLPPETSEVPDLLATPPRPQGRRLVPEAPRWAALVTAAPVLTKGRKGRLPLPAVENLLTAMALDTAKSPHPAIDAAIEHCDAASLRDFSWTVFATWNLVADRANPWALTQLARFADDDTVWRLEALIHEWPGQSLHKRAVRGLELLGSIGTEEALAAVHRVSKHSTYKGLKKAALAEVDRIAARLGLDQEQLLDRLVPDFELDPDGRMTLDYGQRAFTVGFDEQLKPYVVDPKGKARRSLPKPDESDDPEAAAEAAARFDRLKRALKSVGTEQVKRLEKAMTAGRVWSRADFERHLAHHALIRHLVRRLVWQFTTGRGWTSFRVAEDGTLADVRDDVLRLPERSAVRLAHPLHLGEETVAWAEVFADYEVVQPFEQLARPVFALTAEEAATGRVARFEGRSVHTGPLIGLRQARSWWKYTHVFNGAGAPLGLCREIPDIGWFMLDLQPGIDPAYLKAEPHQRLNSVRFSTVESADGPAPQDLDPLLVSELLALLDRHTVR
jgi:hypothetical protein